jgi:hypothetical protein
MFDEMFVEMFDEMFVVGSWNRYSKSKILHKTNKDDGKSVFLYSWVILVLYPNWIVCSSSVCVVVYVPVLGGSWLFF